MSDNNNLSDKEKKALHELQLGKEKVRKGYGKLLEFHHNIGDGMNHFNKATDLLEEAGREEEAEKLGKIVPENVVEDYWTWKLTDKFEDGLLSDVLETDSAIREKMVDGERHVYEEEIEEKRKEEYWDE